ncbi:MAG: TetR/AcrR family transcriptional regulator [Bacteroidales bacterium]|nr:TetR/AcrR family transcriptional regulator [Bacteroidales bacterium]
MSPRTPEKFEEIREEKKELIRQVALKLFANNGYHSTPISQIAKEAGISKGLLYNYFKNKEDLLSNLFNSIANRIINILDPNHDEIITPEEAESFFDRFFEMLTTNPEEWRFFYQLTIQPKVLELILNENMISRAQKNQQLMFNFFEAQNFKDPELAVVLFSSIFKGFTLMYAYAPEMYTKELTNKLKQQMKTMFIKQNKDDIEKAGDMTII